MCFLRDKRSGNIIITIFLLVVLIWVSIITCSLLKKEYEKCFILTNEKKIGDEKIISKYYKRYLKQKGPKYIITKNKKIIWGQDIKKNEQKTDNGFVIENILKNGKVIYNIEQKEGYNYASIIRNFSDYNKRNEIIIIFTKKYFQVSIGNETRRNLEVEIYIKSDYFYDKDLNITKDLNSEIEAVYVKKGFEGTNLYSIF